MLLEYSDWPNLQSELLEDNCFSPTVDVKIQDINHDSERNTETTNESKPETEDGLPNKGSRNENWGKSRPPR